ncbi:cysteine/serine-rich nuclear protein 1 [Bufo gargarizans]|uniref:cysteine/serine-rich nuclear protein 1 n=1 Tax=Bufo gargarizans TaxID=30331 RepID=UPI001CF4AED1|nr:cysteine/serine-rich nuclear protein 1 [Bufo gargarizans]
MSGLLKRKYEALEDDFTYSSSSSSPSSSATSSGGESDDDFSYSPRPLLSNFTPISILKKAKRAKKNKVQFDRVIVFYFQRCQGFTSVPSRGGCTLGMRRKHSYSRQFTLEEFSREQLTRRREKLKERLKEEKLLALKNTFTKNGTIESEKANNLSIDDICDEDIDMTNAEIEDGFSPRMYPAKKRRALLKREGVKKIDKSEKHELNEIRKSREQCGCDCQDFCEPETCSCNLAGIKCQRDHSTFPCGCTKDGCGNPNGRVEFNSSRVQTHFIHTVMKLELEEKRQNNDDGNDKPETLCGERLNPFGCSAVESSEDEERTAPTTTTGTTSPTAPYHFNIDLEPANENSCSSDTTDSSSSSGQSESSEGPFELASSDKSQSDFEEDYLARILHFNDSEYEENSSDCQDNLSFFHSTDFFCDKVYESLYSSEKSANGLYANSLSNISKCVDENANQGADCFTDNEVSVTISTDSTMAPGEPLLKNYMDISLSSENFEIPDETEYNFGPLYNSLNEYENLCSQQCLVTLLPGFTPATDPTASFLESLISSTEPCGDNQYLDDALKSPSPFESLIA